MPWCDTPAMQAHLHEISAAVDPGAHAVIMLDQAGWHMSARLEVPRNITLLPLPPRSPELNPQENVWQFLGQLALQPNLQLLRRHRRPWLPGVEQADQPALAHHVHRPSRLGSGVLINEHWY